MRFAFSAVLIPTLYFHPFVRPNAGIADEQQLPRGDLVSLPFFNDQPEGGGFVVEQA